MGTVIGWLVNHLTCLDSFRTQFLIFPEENPERRSRINILNLGKENVIIVSQQSADVQTHTCLCCRGKRRSNSQDVHPNFSEEHGPPEAKYENLDSWPPTPSITTSDCITLFFEPKQKNKPLTSRKLSLLWQHHWYFSVLENGNMKVCLGNFDLKKNKSSLWY